MVLLEIVTTIGQAEDVVEALISLTLQIGTLLAVIKMVRDSLK